MTDQLHILVTDDEPQIRAMLRRYLLAEGFRITEAANGTELKAAFARSRFDLVLLDLVLPGEDGLSLARHIRQSSAVPIIILTGKGEVIDRVVGLETGADDYIAKPFHLREVLARIRTVLRRAAPAPAPAAGPGAGAGGDVLRFEGWQLELGRRELHRPDGQPVPLTTGEFDLLRALASHPHRVLNRDQLMDLVKGRDWSAFDRTIDAQVVRLRRKIEANPSNPAIIKTVRGAGYVFAATVTSGD